MLSMFPFAMPSTSRNTSYNDKEHNSKNSGTSTWLALACRFCWYCDAFWGLHDQFVRVASHLWFHRRGWIVEAGWGSTNTTQVQTWTEVVEKGGGEGPWQLMWRQTHPKASRQTALGDEWRRWQLTSTCTAILWWLLINAKAPIGLSRREWNYGMWVFREGNHAFTFEVRVNSES